MSPDREAILARRALLLASALAGFARPARADEVESGKLTVEGGTPGASVEIDGKPVGTVPLADALRLAAGPHEVALVGGPCEGEERRTVEVASGSSHVVRFEIECRPHVCLQPCLSPPPPPPPASLPRLGVGAGLLTLMGVPRASGNEPGAALGARVDASYSAPLGDSFTLGLGVAVLPATSGDGALVPIGADLALVAAPGPLRLGLGFTGGWMFASGERSRDETWRPRSSWFVHPYVQPVGFRASDRVEVGAHLGLLLSTWATSGDQSFRPGFVTGSVWVRVYFGEHRRDWEELAAR
ncbi:MAG: hypothetical protein HYZ29_05635 [Myxococcales bacterium]|nr:hypothetical protein [Myxococcales bacterium]